MKQWVGFGFRILSVVAALAAIGCQTQPLPAVGAIEQPAVSSRVAIEAPIAWGGDVRCGTSGCLLGVAEHETGMVALHKLTGRKSRLLDRQRVAYHPDSAVWLSDDLLGAAVETTASIDIFRVENERLVRVHQAHAGFGPRDVILVQAEQGRYTLLATPYIGKEVAWIDWREDNHEAAKLQKTVWCDAPWHPARVKKIPGISAGGGFAVACLNDHKVIAVSEVDRASPPRVLATFGRVVPRYARPSPSGQWLYVSLETGGRNARINMDSGELQWIESPLMGSVAVAPLSDDLVLWSDDGQLYLQSLNAQGAVLETRWLKVSGFATGLQLLDIDGDGERDVVVFNSADKVVDVIYGPLWELAQMRP